MGSCTIKTGSEIKIHGKGYLLEDGGKTALLMHDIILEILSTGLGMRIEGF